jgi:hypothetical protein
MIDRSGKPKLAGRNELISDRLWRRTGIWRPRKVVSSHIQVLHNKLPSDNICKEH